MPRLPNINAIVYFEAVARHSSVSLAAEELVISKSAVNQQIKILEERMGVALFRRAHRRVILTEAGERLYHSATKAIAMLRESQANLSIIRDYRSLTVRTSSSLGIRWLSPLLADFAAAHPTLDLHIDATSEMSDFEKENIDLEIRYSAEMPRGLHCQASVADQVLPLCAPAIAKRANKLGVENALATTRLIHSVKAEIKWREWLDWHAMHAVEATHGLYFDRSLMALEAAQQGQGVALETATLAMDALRGGELVPLAPRLGALTIQSYWLVCPARHLNNSYVRSFIAWMEKKTKAHEREKKKLLQGLGVEVRETGNALRF